MKFKLKKSGSEQPQELSFQSTAGDSFVMTRDGKTTMARYFPTTATVVCRDSDSGLETNYRRSATTLRRAPVGGFIATWHWVQGIRPWRRSEAAIEHAAPGQENRQRLTASKPISVDSPLTGNLLAVHKTEGDPVTAGEVVMVIEAMKMENQITAPIAGTLSGMVVSAGQQVTSGSRLFTIEPIAT